MIGATLAVCAMLGCGSGEAVSSPNPVITVQSEFERARRRARRVVPDPIPLPDLAQPLSVLEQLPGASGGGVSGAAGALSIGSAASCPIPNPLSEAGRLIREIQSAGDGFKKELNDARKTISDLELRLSQKFDAVEGKIVSGVTAAATAPFSAIGSHLVAALEKKWQEVQAAVAPALVGSFLFVLLLLSLIVGLPMRAVMRGGK